ncbi:MAG: response regulator [Gammaproteobacteria bacterium]|nr:response regulator [Gammaproteobacteria bacterium]MCP5406592.1 response regulator [Chromatiaceae bacterium]MCP5409444.1 response regulator [Chromatiaceae bacterium]MCP5444320.1 response regulator [Chromatiaceae bacterium]
MDNPSLIVVDDEIEMAGFVAEVAEVVGFKVSAVTSVQQLRKVLAVSSPTVIVIDIFMPDTDGFELISELADKGCTSGIILISGYGSTLLNGAGKIAAARGLNLLSVISKPFRLSELESVLTSAIRAG